MESLLAISRDISQLLAEPQFSQLYMDHFTDQAKATPPHKRSIDSHLPTVHRVIKALQHLGISNISRIYHVPSDYYSWPTYQRALHMTVPSPAHLCKSVVMKNKGWRPEHPGHQYYCVMVQYAHTINTATMIDWVRDLDGEKKVAKKHYNFRLADSEVSLELTGFKKGGVSPFGVITEIPIILCESITSLQPPVFWMGAGDIDYKLAMPVKSFVNATKCMIADISVFVNE
ncbi:hypothetical protein LPJ66_005613 [Kickxella alabastrina]|uniref:Uncharacterized protein n=1 Tax=Kickxella alabastrina TaxID=61397 RepID=A0ACC1IHV1_9FUNG|nr:hypothetical protein LPJ66_005613 [Kickxella alabastrina]